MTKVPVGGTWTEIFIDPVIFTEYPQSKNLGAYMQHFQCLACTSKKGVCRSVGECLHACC